MRNYIDEYYNGDEAKSIICDAAEEITKLREQVAAQAAVIEKLLTFVKYVAEQTPEKPDYWSSCGQCSSNSDEAEDLLTIPTDNTQILEQYVKEKTQAQAAVIERLTKRLASTNIIMEVVCAIHPDSTCAKYELAENMNALALLTDSTQILAGVRRAERERCAKVCEDFAYQHPSTHTCLAQS